MGTHLAKAAEESTNVVLGGRRRDAANIQPRGWVRTHSFSLRSTGSRGWTRCGRWANGCVVIVIIIASSTLYSVRVCRRWPLVGSVRPAVGRHLHQGFGQTLILMWRATITMVEPGLPERALWVAVAVLASATAFSLGRRSDPAPSTVCTPPAAIELPPTSFDHATHSRGTVNSGHMFMKRQTPVMTVNLGSVYPAVAALNTKLASRIMERSVLIALLWAWLAQHAHRMCPSQEV